MSRSVTFAALIGAVALSCGNANAESLFAFLLPPAQTQFAPQVAPQAIDPAPDEEGEDTQTDARLKRQIVNYTGHEAAGTVIIDTPNTFLYYVLGSGKAIRYGIGVGREGFTWSGVKSVERKAEWPDWYPPAEMLARQPYLPRMTSGGPGNPLGARAMYIAGTQYRIHGTNAPSTIGKQVSSGCIRLKNADVIDLYNRVQVGAKVIVLPQTTVAKAQRAAMTHAYAPQPQSQAQVTWNNIRPIGRY
ncbi:MAG TPA: L,D-transpeptidase [Pseudolabrys sp.]|jgi:lipoprotein-anchoring transpeptidase ErfK/SrfK